MKDGGPAFPTHTPDMVIFGMTLRDWFAGMALQAHLNENFLSRDKDGGAPWDNEDIAIMCYMTADAMLKEREK